MRTCARCGRSLRPLHEIKTSLEEATECPEDIRNIRGYLTHILNVVYQLALEIECPLCLEATFSEAP